METLPIYIRDHAVDQLLSWNHQLTAAERFGVGVAQVEEIALERGILPGRYQRNRRVIAAGEQLELFRSRVAVIGCGGLGGYIIEELARLGVGQLVVVDPDCFEEHNLNRQLLSSPSNLGRPKVEAAVRRVADINPAVTVIAHEHAFCADNAEYLLADCRVAVDALDSIPVRLELAAACSSLCLPLVHGAIAGWFGHVATVLPGSPILRQLYPREGLERQGIEQQLGNPAFTPAVVASLQAAEVCKLLLGKGERLVGRSLTIDLLAMEFHEVLSE